MANCPSNDGIGGKQACLKLSLELGNQRATQTLHTLDVTFNGSHRLVAAGGGCLGDRPSKPLAGKRGGEGHDGRLGVGSEHEVGLQANLSKELFGKAQGVAVAGPLGADSRAGAPAGLAVDNGQASLHLTVRVAVKPVVHLDLRQVVKAFFPPTVLPGAGAAFDAGLAPRPVGQVRGHVGGALGQRRSNWCRSKVGFSGLGILLGLNVAGALSKELSLKVAVDWVFAVLGREGPRLVCAGNGTHKRDGGAKSDLRAQ